VTDRDREREIDRLMARMKLAVEVGDFNEARRFFHEASELVAGRSAERVEQMEERQGLR
jgi:extradiol dioxygenase family protein